jgi:hypothetical protein
MQPFYFSPVSKHISLPLNTNYSKQTLNIHFMKHSLILTFFLAICTVVTAQDKTISKSFSNITNIKLSTSSGDITLKKGSGTEVKVSVKYSFDEGDYKPVLEQNSSRLTLKEEFSGGSHSGNSSWTLEIPDNIKINTNTGSGDITVDGVAIDIKSNTGSGDITLSAVKGDLDFNTGSGNIEIEKGEGDIRLNTGSGNVKASDGSGNYSINAGSGDIRLDQLKGDFAINTGSGDIQAKAITMNGSSSFNTGSGDASVTLVAALANNISVNSGSGDATLNFNGNPISGEIIMTANKKGGNIVAPFKFDKEETIDDDNSSVRIRKTAKLGDKDITIKVGTGSGTAEITR